MAEFKAYNSDVEVNRNAALSLVNSMDKGKETRLNYATKAGVDFEKQEWINQQVWLDVFKSIAEDLGPMNLFLIGKAVIENADFPPIENLEQALRSLDIAYHMNHRKNGEVMFNPETGKIIEGIGHYSLTHYDEQKKEATVVCNNPYPSKFDEGLLVQMVRKFKSTPGIEKIELDTTKEQRSKGGESCTYLISW